MYTANGGLNKNANLYYVQSLTSTLQFKILHRLVSSEACSQMKSWFITCFANVSCFPPYTWHISFRTHYAVFVFCFWMWKNYMQLHIQSLLLVRQRMLSICGCTTTLMEIPNKGHGQLSPELDTAHWNVVVFPATFQTGYIHLLLKPPYPRIII